MSRTSEANDPWASQGPPPDWLGDVTAGVAAWTHAATPTASPAPLDPPDPAREVPEADAEAVARKILLDQLTGQARSRKELADKLSAKNVPAELATRLLDRFEEVGLIDDSAFARSWIASRGASGSRALARRALAQELRRKGIADEVARDALDEIDAADEREAARALVRRKLRSMARVDDQAKTRRLVGMLGRKGYPPGLAFAVVKEELRSVGADVDDASMPESDL